MKTKWLVIGLMFTGGLLAAQTAPQKLLPNEVQQLRLQIKQKDAQLAQRDMQDATTKFQQALKDLTDESNRVKTENKWDTDVQFDPNTLTFTKPAPAPAPVPKAPAPVTKPAEKK